MVILL